MKVLSVVNEQSRPRLAKRLEEFIAPERATAEQPLGKEYRIYGCVTRTNGGVQESVQGGVVAYLQEGDWYFTPYFISYGSDVSPLPCKPSKTSNTLTENN